MVLKKIRINKFRSIEDVELFFPKNKPLILFGPNNAGKSNILNAINRLLGEKYPSYVEMTDSDFFKRDSAKYPTATISATFDESLDQKPNHNKLRVVYSKNESENKIVGGDGEKWY